MTEAVNDHRIISPAPATGVTQHELVAFGSLLAEQGVNPEIVNRVTHRLQEIATESAYKGAAEVILTLQQVAHRQEQVLAWHIDSALRALRTTLLGMRTTLNHVDRGSVVAIINGMLSTPEPVNVNRNIGRQ